MIEAKELYHQYDKNGEYVLRALNFTINRGEFVFVIGQSGAGKSTLLKLLIREIAPSKGSLSILGQDLAKLPRHKVPYLRRNIGMVFQDFRLLDERTAFDNIAFSMRVTGASNSDIRNRVPHVLEMVGLADKAGARVRDLSGGEQQRVGLARAIANRPALIVADEPTGNLDPDTSLEIMNLLRNINFRGTTVLIATHDREIVDRLKKRVICLEKGKIAGDEQKGVYARAL
ncbi:MAG: cell division ATP-binding protein FtsE [Dethiobacter sp.]|jgi:cell division transport system ATP-binding protein|nr:cell division ATP-binding protein FtsE [Dethiobacter sp.]